MKTEILLEKIKENFKNDSDVIYKTIQTSSVFKKKITLVFSDTISDKNLISESVVEPLVNLRFLFWPLKLSAEKILSTIDATNTSIIKADDTKTVFEKINIGECILLLDGSDKVIIAEVKKYPTRSVGEPKSKSIIDGPKEGFTESIHTNTGLIKKRLRSSNLEISMHTLGKNTLNFVALFSMKGIVDPKLLCNAQKVLQDNAATDIASLDELISLFTGRRFAFLPLVEATERTDEAVNALLDGHTVAIMDNSPFALILPGTLKNFMSTGESRSSKSWVEKANIYLRFLLMLLAMMLPGIYIATVQYNPEFLSDKLILLISLSRQSVPFPPFFEIFFIELIFEAIIEASLRMPEKISFTISIVGSLILGQAIVDANIVNPFVVVLVALTSILTFTVPNHHMAKAVRGLKFLYMAAAALLGFFGIELLTLIIAISICSMGILGVNYMETFVGKEKRP